MKPAAVPTPHAPKSICHSSFGRPALEPGEGPRPPPNAPSSTPCRRGIAVTVEAAGAPAWPRSPRPPRDLAPAPGGPAPLLHTAPPRAARAPRARPPRPAPPPPRRAPLTTRTPAAHAQTPSRHTPTQRQPTPKPRETASDSLLANSQCVHDVSKHLSTLSPVTEHLWGGLGVMKYGAFQFAAISSS